MRLFKIALISFSAAAIVTLIVLIANRGRGNERQAERIIAGVYETYRPYAARLTGLPYNRVSEASAKELGIAQLLLLQSPPEERHSKELQAKLFLMSRDWARAARALELLVKQSPEDATLVNDLGVAYFALGDSDPLFYFKALDVFTRATTLSPKAAEPNFNSVLLYSRLGLSRLMDDASHRYTSLDPTSEWTRELTEDGKIDSAVFLERFRMAIESKQRDQAKELLVKYPDLYRRIAFDRLMAGMPLQEDEVTKYIAAEMKHEFHDNTIAAMYESLAASRRVRVLTARSYIVEGSQAAVRGDVEGSLRAYENAREWLETANSEVDQLWLLLNRAELQIKIGQYDAAKNTLGRIITRAKADGFLWILAQARSMYGSSPNLTSDNGAMMNVLRQADNDFINIGATTGRGHTLYYLATCSADSGDDDTAIRLILRALTPSNDLDPSTRARLDLLMSTILYHKELVSSAVLFAKESDYQAEKTSDPVLRTKIATNLGFLYERLSDHSTAQKYLAQATAELTNISNSQFEADRINVNLLEATIRINKGDYASAITALQQNVTVLSRLSPAVGSLRSQNNMLMGRAYAADGSVADARQAFHRAISNIEEDDRLQMQRERSFEDERRELYEAAIAFEFDNSEPDTAWFYLQQYRARLFTELAARSNPNIQATQMRVLDRRSAQRSLNRDIQVVEYTLLKNRLLIWFLNESLSSVHSVLLDRAAVEEKVRVTLKRLRSGEDCDALLTELGKLLIAPITPLVDPNRRIVIIPDGALHGLPFSALRISKDGHYLIEDFSITIAPSLAYFLGTAPGVGPAHDKVVGFGSRDGAAAELKELHALASIYPKPSLFTGSSVDKSSFLKQLTDAAVFHYAGHSVTDTNDPLRSSILLDAKRTDATVVTAEDVSRHLIRNNSLVVLSSCDSSVGNSHDGIGLRGLTSAFLIGGAGAVVGSLWPVEASSTADLMIFFHRAFEGSRMTAADSLREAQLRFVKSHSERSNPYYWSAFEVTGNLTAVR